MIQLIKLRPLSIARYGRKSALRVRGMLNTAHLRCSTSISYRANAERPFPGAKAQGFTLVELILATAFIAFILIFMLSTMVQVMSNYNKGLAVKQINQTARTVAEEMGRLIQGANASAINTSRIANGRVCVGGVSYVWNIRGNTTNRYADNTPVKFVRVNDSAGALCGAALPNVTAANASEMLGGQIWVQEVNVVVSANQSLADTTLSLSTSSPNQPTGTDATLGTICDGGKDSQYCAIATFRTTVATKNGGG